MGDLLPERRLAALIPGASEILVGEQTCRCIAYDGDAPLGIVGGVRSYAARRIDAQVGENSGSHAQTGGRIREAAVHRVARTCQQRLVRTIKEKQIVAVRSHVTEVES